jgi:hypothetical protein
MMTDRPILFSAEMVRAILDGRKTQTRRNIKYTTEHRGPINPAYLEAHKDHPGWKDICPYGQPGDFLWVREAHAISANPDLKPWYRLDHEEARSSGPRVDVKWRPSIHMPRWASRITLEVKGVRVERLQDISEDDAKAEGCEARPFPGPWWEGYRDLGDGELIHQQAVGETAPYWMIEPKKMPLTPWLDRSARDGFRSIWMGLYGPDAWDENPWVWVVAFERWKP